MDLTIDKTNRRIFYICTHENNILGGAKKIYQHVDILNKHGYKAWVFHFPLGFRYTWFKNITPIAYPSHPLEVHNRLYPGEVELTTGSERLPPINNHDILVVPEIFAYPYTSVPSHQPFVIFNQNAYYTFNLLSFPESPFRKKNTLINTPYSSPNLLATIVVSKNNFDYLQYIFPTLHLYRIRLSVDPNKFVFSSLKNKQIAYMPHKRIYDLPQILGILLMRGNLKEWVYVPIIKRSEEEVIDILKSSWMFFSLPALEGFPLPPMEAMLCGCFVGGYDGFGGKEYIHPPFAEVVENEDILGFAKAIEKIATQIENDPQGQLKKAEQNRELIKSLYSPQKEEEDLLNVWNAILSKPITASS